LSALVVRARSAIGRPTIYSLGKGGMSPTAEHPANFQARCDCSGFVCWVLGVSRWRGANGHPWPEFPAEWISTSSIHSDALKTLKRFRRVLTAEPGDLLVYGDHAGGEGHVGIIGDVFGDDPSSVIHCSAGNGRQGDAIRETSVGSFWKNRNAIIARPIGG
jgi:cell wall-associated NlpC family hydrolase